MGHCASVARGRDGEDPPPVQLAVAVAGLAATGAFVRDTEGHVHVEQKAATPRPRRRALLATWSQAGFVNNLNDALAWGLVPLYLAAHGATAAEIGAVAAAYPAVWGFGQLLTGWLSDRAGRAPLIVVGMLVQAGALALLVGTAGAFGAALAASVLLGVGTALV